MRYLSYTFLVLLSVTCAIAADGNLARYFEGTVSRDLDNALMRAQRDGKPLVVYVFEANRPDEKKSVGETPNQYAFRCFTDEHETKMMLKKHFIQVLAAKGPKTDGYLDPDNKSHDPVAVFLDKNGLVITRLGMNANPTDVMKKVQAIVSGL